MHEISKIEHQRIAQALEDLVERVVARHRDTPDLVVTAVANGGLVFARKLAQSLALRLCRDVPIGVVNIAFHRDDIGQRNPRKRIRTARVINVDGPPWDRASRCV